MDATSVTTIADRPVFYKAGTVIFVQGKPTKYLYMVKSGEVRLMKKNGSHLTVFRICKAKEILNEVNVLLNHEAEYTAIAKTDVEVVMVEQNKVLSVIKTCPPWVNEIFHTLCDRLNSTIDIVVEHNIQAQGEPGFTLAKDEEERYLKAMLEYRQK